MQKCPKCNHYTVEYSSHNSADSCTRDGCSCIVYDSSSYSYLRPDAPSRTISRVKVIRGGEDETIKRYNMPA